jgi:2-polyprenyl-3-methyl-5-hydroxy-6-metoxy-1,4-benzoquinol methylase
MTGPRDQADVLAAWGDDHAGPMNGESGRHLSARLVRIIRRDAPLGSICDLGCGNGFLAAQLAALADRVVGIDASKRLIDRAVAHHQAANVEYRHALFGPELSNDLARQPFDLVVSADVIEHLYRPMILIETASRILKPGGRFIVCTPYHGYLKNLAISVAGKWDAHHGVHWDGGHIKFFSPRTLSAMVATHFSVDAMEYYGRAPFFWKNMIAIATRK